MVLVAESMMCWTWQVDMYTYIYDREKQEKVQVVRITKCFSVLLLFASYTQVVAGVSVERVAPIRCESIQSITNTRVRTRSK